MKPKQIEQLKPGNKLAKPLFDQKGNLLLHQQTVLNEHLIERLKKYEIDQVYVTSPTIDSPLNLITKSKKEKWGKELKKSFYILDDTNFVEQTYVIEAAAQDLKKIVCEIHKLVYSNSDIVSLISDVVEFDDYLYHHSLNVATYSLAIARELNFSQASLEDLGLAALLHDIGKMKVPEDIVFKSGRLTEQEFQEIQKHTYLGYEIVKQIPNIPQSVLRTIYEHHERLDGSGYPQKLAGNQIHPFAKIIAVADVFDAITTERVYKDKQLPHEALEVLYAGSGTLFEPKFIELFRNNVAVYPNGMRVTLSDGRKGVIKRQNKDLSDRPVVEISSNKHESYELNLAKHFNIVVTAIQS
ncbi:HD-GYP domain-containing protein [Salinibacillus xinjiangensis]|uniref:HD domain-containing protein n=1 Tax=Salinibacillus xinjiangensis TaxID=1229268 RepID=A0A6G1X2P2_9BACI|nr:HD-GYP domain-containing protein [Salinibacillus xinjiangensis]MRG85165.1 HD domain-containing protein [Salinibacillus xinjiangensis]